MPLLGKKNVILLFVWYALNILLRQAHTIH